MANSANLNRLKTNFPKDTIGTMETYIIAGRVYVTSGFLMGYFKVGDKTIRNYTKEGMPESKYTIAGRGGLKIYDLNDCVKWRLGNIDQVQAGKSSKKELEIDLENELNEVRSRGLSLRRTEAETIDAELKAELNKIKLAEAEGRVVDAEDLDKAMAEQAVIHKTDKTNDEKILPIILENKSSDEIATILHEHQQERLEMLDRLINKKFESKSTLYDIVEEALEQLNYDIEPDEIIKRLRAN